MPEHMTKEEKLNYWFDRVERANKALEKQAGEWKERLRNYEGLYFKGEDPEGHQFSANIVQGLAKLVVPSIYFRDPKILCSPRRPNTEEQCRLTESLLNYWIGEMGLKKIAKQVLLDAYLFGTGYVKVGYEVRTEEDLEPVTNLAGEPLSTDTQEALLQNPKGSLFMEREGRPIPVMDKDTNIVPDGKEVVSFNKLRRRDEPWVARWEPWNVLRDPEGKEHDLSDARFVIFRSVLPLEEVKGNPFYSNTTNLRGTEIPRSVLDKAELDFWNLAKAVDEKDERVELFEVWAREWNKERARWDMHVYVLAKGHNRFLLEQRSPYLAEGFPIRAVYFVEHPRSQWAPSLLKIIDPQINTINHVLTYIANFREKYVNKYIFNELVMSREDASKVMKGKDEAVGVTLDPESPIANAIDTLPLPSIPNWVFNDYELAWEIIMRLTGMSDYQLGGQGVSRQATEASYIQGAFNVRINEQQDIVGDWVKEIARYVKQLLQQYGDYQTTLKITGDTGEETWRTFTIAETIPEDLDFNVEVYPAEHNSKEVEMKRALDMYNLLRQDPLVNPQKLLERVFRAFGEQSPEAMFVQQQALDPQTGQPIGHGGAADAGAIDVNQIRQPANVEGGNSGRAFGG